MATAESTLLHGIGDTGGGDGELSVGLGEGGGTVGQIESKEKRRLEMFISRSKQN